MEDDFHLDLLGREAAMLECVVFVDELYGDDGLGRIDGRGFADGSVGALADGFADEAEGEVGGKGSDLTLRSH